MARPSIDFGGVHTALVTPFAEDGSVDWECFDKLVQRQIDGGVRGLVPCGTTGETPTLSADERKEVISRTIRIARAASRPVLVIAGTGSNSTAGSVDMTKWAKEAGADACLVVNPYYNKPSQAGLVRHVTAIAEVGLPIMLYNIPGRTGVNMTPETIARLYEECPSVVAVKEATGDMDAVSGIRVRCRGIQILSGDDSVTIPLMSLGGVGVVSVASNLYPAKMVEIVSAAAKGDYEAARTSHYSIFSLLKAMFVETNPVPIKAAMANKGLLRPDVRAPLAPLEPSSLETVERALAAVDF